MIKWNDILDIFEEANVDKNDLMYMFDRSERTVSNWKNGRTPAKTVFNGAEERIINRMKKKGVNPNTLRDYILEKIKDDEDYDEKSRILNNHWNVSIEALVKFIIQDYAGQDINIVPFQNEYDAFFNAVLAEEKNIRIMLKSAAESQTSPYSSLEAKFNECDSISFVNYAGTSFLSGEKIAKAYESFDNVTRYFYERLFNGNIKAHFCLTNPHSPAGRDAAVYKMKPKGQKKDSDRIITDNIRTLQIYKATFGEHDNIKLSLTDIALPYGIVMSESSRHVDGHYDSMKVDLYSPFDKPGKDGYRPSFFILKEINPELFSLFSEAVDAVERQSVPFDKPNIEWINKNKHIIHRCRYSNLYPEHSVTGALRCISEGFPMEIDLLKLNDDTLIVGREFKFKDKYGNEHKLSDLTLKQIHKMKTEEYTTMEGNAIVDIRFEEILSFSDFLNLVDGKVPLLIEPKLEASDTREDNEKKAKELAKDVLDVIWYYQGPYAIHCSNKWVLTAIRDIDPTIALGQISMNFESLYNSKIIKEWYYSMHKNMDFFVDNLCNNEEKNNNMRWPYSPDFISYKGDDITEDLLSLCREKNLPLIVWTIKSKEEFDKVKNPYSRNITNYIVEGCEEQL